jgi:hypothetical protein
VAADLRLELPPPKGREEENVEHHTAYGNTHLVGARCSED